MALRNGTNLRYVHLDHLGSTSVVTDSSGNECGYMRYFPYGSTRDESGSLYTTKLFTGQRRDSTSLYYYGARYYSHGIGRFISPDSIVPDPKNPQSLNRYSYCLNNPLRYVDPSGHQEYKIDWGYDASGQPLAPPPAAFGPGGYYGGQYGSPIPYNSYTTVNGPPVSEPQPDQADSNLPVSNANPDIIIASYLVIHPQPTLPHSPFPRTWPPPPPPPQRKNWAAVLDVAVGGGLMITAVIIEEAATVTGINLGEGDPLRSIAGATAGFTAVFPYSQRLFEGGSQRFVSGWVEIFNWR